VCWMYLSRLTLLAGASAHSIYCARPVDEPRKLVLQIALAVQSSVDQSCQTSASSWNGITYVVGLAFSSTLSPWVQTADKTRIDRFLLTAFAS
jgi:hypothetical protein